MFIISYDYDRDELLNFVGSKQQQSGIIWGNKEPACVIVTSGGRGGKRMGYSDKIREDGTILYIGQGEKGDQNPYKFANALLTNGERSVLFFTTREPKAVEVKERGSNKKLYKFVGIFEVASWDYFIPEAGKRKGNKLVRYLLVPANNIIDTHSGNLNQNEERNLSLSDLKKKLENKSAKPEKGISSSKEYFKRSETIIAYAKARANGLCECCGKPAPFVDSSNLPFLEVHHIFRLADDGPDEPENVAAICPNCHREAHYGNKKEEIKLRLVEIISKKESLLRNNL
ncbi:MAG: HNH endonuclease [Flavisolibacter sp.]|nr:HNH endonuclease [Flavisolibacter sp.]